MDLAETFFLNITKKYKDEKLYHSYSDSFVFLEDYAYYIKMLLDLADTTMAFEYKQKAQELCIKAIDKFYDKNKNIFQKNILLNDDLFFNPVDIGDSTISNGNSIMLNNLVRLGLLDQAEKLSQSLFGYLNFYKRLMLSSLKSLDYFQEIKAGKIVVTMDVKFSKDLILWIVWFLLVVLWNYGFPNASPFLDVLIARERERESNLIVIDDCL